MAIHDVGRDMVECAGLEPAHPEEALEVSDGQAILHEPDLLILDEPTNGLDPNQIVEIRNVIKEIGKEKTVILSTHIMQEVEALCSVLS